MRSIHELKIWPEYFDAVLKERKTFELRIFDRDFKVHDFVKLKEWVPEKETYTGREIEVYITYILVGESMKFLENEYSPFCIFSFKILNKKL